jgi:hypothetical protein
MLQTYVFGWCWAEAAAMQAAAGRGSTDCVVSLTADLLDF